MKTMLFCMFLTLLILPSLAIAESQPELYWKYELGRSIIGVAVASQKDYLVVGSGESVYLFDRNGTTVWKYDVDLPFLQGVGISPQGDYVVVGTYIDAYLLDKKKKLIHMYEVKGSVRSVAVSSQGDHVAVSFRDSIYFFDKLGNLFLTFGVRNVEDVAVSSYGYYIVAGSDTGVYLFDKSGGTLWKYEVGDPVHGVGISSQGDYVVAGSENGNVYFFNKHGLLLWKYEIGDVVYGVGISSKGEYIVAGSKDGNVYFFNRDGILLWKYEIGDVVYGVGISSQGDYMVAGSENGNVYLLESPPDIAPRSVIITSPDNTTVFGKVAINAALVDPSAALSVKIDGTEVSTTLPYTWDTNTVTDGNHTITVAVGNLTGNIFLDSLEVTVNNTAFDKTPPFVKIVSPFNASSVSGAVDILATIDDPLAEVSLKIDGTEVSTSLPYMWNTSTAMEGVHVITLTAVDKAGNTGYDSITVEKITPTEPHIENPPEAEDKFDPYLYGLLILLLLAMGMIKDKDLRILLVLTLLAVLFVLIPPMNKTPLRILFALPLLLFIPGYSLISALFPRKKDLTLVERFTLGIGLSIAISVFDGFALNYTWGFRPTPIVITLSFIALFLVGLASLTRSRIPADERFSLPFAFPKFPKENPTKIEKALIVALVLSIIIVSGMLVYAKLTSPKEKFTAFYILGKDGKAEDYPSQLYLGRTYNMPIGIENYESARADYILEVRLDNHLLKKEGITLANKETWFKNVSFIPTQTGDRLKLEFLLYKDGSTEPYRSTHLWVSTNIDYTDPYSFKKYALSEIPVVENGDMELRTGWIYIEKGENFTGGYTNLVYASPTRSYEISYPRRPFSKPGDYGVISQDIPSKGEGLAIVTFNVRDSFKLNKMGIHLKQVLLNEQVIWEDDLAGDEGWLHVKVPAKFINGTNQLMFRVYEKKSGNSIKVWWDGIKIEPLSTLTNRGEK